MKKTTILFLCFACILFILAGCGPGQQGTTSAPAGEINVLYMAQAAYQPGA